MSLCKQSAGLQLHQLSLLLGSRACLNKKPPLHPPPPNNEQIPVGGTRLQQRTRFALLSKSYKLSFLPDNPQGFLTDWSEFWKEHDISNFVDLGLGGRWGLLLASRQLGGACVLAFCVCLTTGSTRITLCGLFSVAVLCRLTRTVRLSQPQHWDFSVGGGAWNSEF